MRMARAEGCRLCRVLPVRVVRAPDLPAVLFAVPVCLIPVDDFPLPILCVLVVCGLLGLAVESEDCAQRVNEKRNALSTPVKRRGGTGAK